MAWKALSVFIALATLTQSTHAQAGELQEIALPKKLLKTLKTFEPSAVVYLKDENVFLVASDDTDEADAAMLFLMDDKGQVENKPVLFDGIETMTDIESLSIDGEYVYIMSSQSRNKKGKVLEERNLFVRGKFDGKEIKNTEVVELRPLLLKALAASTEPQITKLQGQFDSLLETEASLVRNGQLLVGLKDPQSVSSGALVLNLGDVDVLFKTKKLNKVSVAFELPLSADNKLSDMIASGDKLVLASTIEAGGGHTWSYDEVSGQLMELNKFSGKPEGLAIGKNQDQLLVLFDQGEDDALFTFETLK